MKRNKKSKMSQSIVGNRQSSIVNRSSVVGNRQSSIVNRKCKMGLTLVEVLMSILLVGAGAAMIYKGSMYSYKTMMRSRARLSAQGIAFDKLWSFYNLQSPVELLMQEDLGWQWEPTHSNTVFGTNGAVEWVVEKPGGTGTNYWNIWVRVYAYPSPNSAYNMDSNKTAYCTNDNLATVLFPAGRDPKMAEYVVRRSNQMR